MKIISSIIFFFGSLFSPVTVVPAETVALSPTPTNIAALCVTNRDYAVDEGSRVSDDFDQDNIPDVTYRCISSDPEIPRTSFLELLLSNTPGAIALPLGITVPMSSYIEGVLTVGGCEGNGRYCEYLLFEYNKVTKKLELIGYNEENYGNASHEGSYAKVVDLKTQKYSMQDTSQIDYTPAPKFFLIPRTLPLKGCITPGQIDEAFLDVLRSVGSTHKP